MMLEALRGLIEDCPSIVEFNPWQWMGPEYLAAAFFHEIGVALGKSDSSKEGKQRAAKWQAYGKYLTLGISLTKPLKAALSFAGMLGANVVLDPLITGMEESSRVIQEGSDITALFDIDDELPDEPDGVYSIAADMHALRIIHWYLMQESNPGERGQTLKAAMNATRGIFLPVRQTDMEDAKHQKSSGALLLQRLISMI